MRFEPFKRPLPPLSPSLLISVAMVFAASSTAIAGGVSSSWVEGQKSRARLYAGSIDGRDYAFLAIELEPGWKTYWRNPGDAGGLPPEFDWSSSENVDVGAVLYPAPIRMSDKAGDTIGYKGGMTLPVEINRKDIGREAQVAVTVQYGICKDVCIPAEASLAVRLPAGALANGDEEAREALNAVPRPQDRRKEDDPAVVAFQCAFDEAAPRIVVEAKFAGGGEGAEVYLDAPGGLFVPHPIRTGDASEGAVRFEARLGADVDVAALSGSSITATLVDGRGASSAVCDTRR